MPYPGLETGAASFDVQRGVSVAVLSLIIIIIIIIIIKTS